jgi:hypothetical protein
MADSVFYWHHCGRLFCLEVLKDREAQMVTNKVSVTSKGSQKVLDDLLEEISRLEVYVGIPEEGSARDDEITNAQLAFIHTHGARSVSMRKEMQDEMDAGSPYSAAHQMYVKAHGSPLYHIPPRPIIEPAIEAKGNKEPIAHELGLAAKGVLDKKPEEAKRHLELAGMTGANAAQAWFDDPRNDWPENAPATIERKGSEHPLIDSGEMRKSITYVVKEQG